jgi:hypothetical protein
LLVNSAFRFTICISDKLQDGIRSLSFAPSTIVSLDVLVEQFVSQEFLPHFGQVAFSVVILLSFFSVLQDLLQLVLFLLPPQQPAVCPLQEVNVRKALATNIVILILLFIFSIF